MPPHTVPVAGFPSRSMHQSMKCVAVSGKGCCANEAVGEVIDLVVEEMKAMKQAPVLDSELRRAKDHLKGSVMLSLENTSSRMSHLARQEIYFDRQCGLDETLSGIEQVTADDVRRVAADLFRNDSLSATVLGSVNGLTIPRERLGLD